MGEVIQAAASSPFYAIPMAGINAANTALDTFQNVIGSIGNITRQTNSTIHPQLRDPRQHQAPPQGHVRPAMELPEMTKRRKVGGRQYEATA